MILEKRNYLPAQTLCKDKSRRHIAESSKTCFNSRVERPQHTEAPFTGNFCRITTKSQIINVARYRIG